MEEHEKKTIIKNLKWLTISKIIVYLLSIITITLIPRYLGVEGYGQYNFILSFVGLFSIIGDFGLTTLVLRDIAKYPDKAKEYFNNLLLFKFILFVFFLVIVSIVTIIIEKDNPGLINLIVIYSIGVGFTLISGFILSFFDASQKLEYRAISEIISKVIYTIGVIAIILLNYKLQGIIIASTFSFLIGALYVLFCIKSKFEITLKFDIKYIKQKMLLAYPFLLTTIFWGIYFSIDRIFLAYMKGDYYVGLYSIGYAFIGFLLGILGVLNATFFPVISKFANDKAKLANIVKKYLLLVYFFCVPVTIGGIYLAPKIISLVFGNNFVSGTTAFQLIMFFFLLNAIGIINYYLLITNKFEKYSLKLLGISALINIILNFIFIPWLGIIGAAITTIISEIVIFIGSNFKIRKYIIVIDYLKPIFKPLLAGFLMLLGLIFYTFISPQGILHNKFDVLISIAIGGAIYITILFITKSITIKQIREMFKNKLI